MCMWDTHGLVFQNPRLKLYKKNSTCKGFGLNFTGKRYNTSCPASGLWKFTQRWCLMMNFWCSNWRVSSSCITQRTCAHVNYWCVGKHIDIYIIVPISKSDGVCVCEGWRKEGCPLVMCSLKQHGWMAVIHPQPKHAVPDRRTQSCDIEPSVTWGLAININMSWSTCWRQQRLFFHSFPTGKVVKQNKK